ncbi:Spc98 family-domain-containing protein [Globomyces pollinis-pini]|nr:Spc98 family-domain-containing protein [Globomyces pollinis-pini]
MEMLGNQKKSQNPLNSKHNDKNIKDVNDQVSLISKALLELTTLFLSPNNPNHPIINPTHQYCLKILSSRLATPNLDQLHLITMIQKKLLTQDNQSKHSLRIPIIMKKIEDLNSLRFPTSILYFLMTIGKSKNEPAKYGNISLLNLGLSKIQKESNIEIIKEPSKEHADSQKPKASVFNQYYKPVSQDVIKLTESDLLRDLLYVFQGINGKYIKYCEKEEKFKLDNDVSIPKPTRLLVDHLCKLGWLYKNIHSSFDRYQKTTMGLFQQSFISNVQTELKSYYHLIAVLEANLDEQLENKEGFVSKRLSLKRLFVWVQGPLQRLRVIGSLLDICQDKKGGAILSSIQSYAVHGDPTIREFIQELLMKISKPFYSMLHRWIYEGELDDPFGEFFVSINQTEDDNFWKSKYILTVEMIPSFISINLANKIFLIGKSLNFIRYSCLDSIFKNSKGSKKQLEYGDLKTLELSIGEAYQISTKHLLNILFNRYNLVQHLSALKSYLLLGQGDFVQYLMDSLGDTLSKSAGTIYRHNLTGTLESAIRSSTAQSENPDVLKRLDVRLMEISAGETGWDIFLLDYHVDSPINTILTPQAMHIYHRLFSFLWRLKRVDHTLSNSWHSHTTQSNRFKSAIRLKMQLHKCHLLRNEMIHFINQLEHYILFEVIECHWKELIDKMEAKDCDLDLLIKSHDQYLSKIMSKGLLYTGTNHTVTSKLLNLFQIIFDFDEVQKLVYDVTEKELLMVSGDLLRTREQDESIQTLTTQIETQSGLFKQELESLIHVLAIHPDQSLQVLSTRWNFNEIYSTI